MIVKENPTPCTLLAKMAGSKHFQNFLTTGGNVATCITQKTKIAVGS